MRAIEIQELARVLDDNCASVTCVLECAAMIEQRNADSFHSPSFVERATRNWRSNRTTEDELANEFAAGLHKLPDMLKDQAY